MTNAQEKSAGKFMRSLSSKAEQLYKARKEIDVIEARHKRELETHYAKISRLRSEVLTGLKIVGLSSVKLRNGDAFAKSKTVKFEIKNEIAFDRWARDNRYTRIDREIAKQRLQNLAQKNKLPEWAVAVPGETIAYRKKPGKAAKKS